MAWLADEQALETASDMPRAPKAMESWEAAAFGITFGMVMGSARSRDW